MEQIVTALLCQQRKVTVKGIEVDLPTLKNDTQKRKEKEARKIAKETIKLIEF